MTTHPQRSATIAGSVVDIYPDRGALVESCASRIAEVAAASIRTRGRFLVALSGGSTPIALYQRLASPDAPPIDWARTLVFFGDERGVPPDSPSSNYRMAKENLLEPAGVPSSSVVRVEAERGVEEAAQRYEERLRETFTSSSTPSFDLVLLGLGTDARTASLFPGTPAIHETDRWVVGQPLPHSEFDRVTMTPPVLNEARHGWFLVTGANKAAALHRVLLEPASFDEAPAKVVSLHDGDRRWWVDEAAASQLPIA